MVPITITIDLVIPNCGITILPDGSIEYKNSEPTYITLSFFYTLEGMPQWDNFKTLPTNNGLESLKSLNYGKSQILVPQLPEVTLETVQSPRKPQEPELVSLTRQCVNNNGIELCPLGVGGTYFIKNEKDQKIAVFKPTDEEPGAHKNPKDLLEGEPLLPPGGGSKRELAAYLLDHGQAGVPETHLVKDMKSKNFNGEELKSGSVQKFVENIGDTTSIGSSHFLTEDVHNIGILDIRLMNMDRNDENMLIRKEGDKYRLLPIDHAFTLPPTLGNVWFDWMYWKQAKLPFAKEQLDYIRCIDIESDAKILRDLGIEEESIQTMEVATILLKKGASLGLTLYDIASMVSRKKNQLSELETLVNNTLKQNGKINLIEFERQVEAHIVKSKP